MYFNILDNLFFKYIYFCWGLLFLAYLLEPIWAMVTRPVRGPYSLFVTLFTTTRHGAEGAGFLGQELCKLLLRPDSPGLRRGKNAEELINQSSGFSWSSSAPCSI